MVKEKKRYSRTIFKQLVFFTVVISILPITFLSLFLYHKIETMAKQELMDSYQQLASQYMDMVCDKLIQYEKSLIFVSKNTTILEELSDQTGRIDQTGAIISKEVVKSLLLEGQGEIRNCMVYSEKEDFPVYGSRVSMIGAAERETWFSYYKGQKGKWFFWPSCGINPEGIASLVYGIEKVDVNSFGQEELGIVKLDIYMERLFGISEHSGFDILVCDSQGTVWYVSNKKSRDFIKQYPDFRPQDDGGKIVKNLGDQVIYTSPVEASGLRVLLLFGNRGLADKKEEVEGLLIPVIFLIIGIVIVGSYLFAGGFSRRVNLLVHKFKVAETGNLATTAPIYGGDEISVLDEQFSHMLKKLDQLIQKNYVQELNRKETELKNLRLQINPHFLYNTLETISSIAAVRQVFVVCDICEKLGEIFRYSLGKNYGELVTVEQELHHVQNYIFIQKLRYGNKFEVFYNIEPGMEQCMLLRFILQPIVENAIVHGIGPMTGSGTLEITVERREDQLLVKIEDDGVGMDQRKLEDLRAYIDRPEMGVGEENKSIGVRNVNRRIKLTCGEKYGVRMESEPYQGSSFIITFPLKKKGGEE